MAEDGCGQPNERRPGDWFAHVGNDPGELESTTSASLKHVLNSAAALGPEHRLPLVYKGREQKAGNNNFPFSSHDNRHDICNAAEYFDLGMGLRKLDPEKQKKNSHNFFEWAQAPDQTSSESFATVYRTTYVTNPTPESESCSCRRYPKHHTQKEYSDNKPAPGDDKALQPYKPS